jgi:hypothetical protein
MMWSERIACVEPRSEAVGHGAAALVGGVACVAGFGLVERSGVLEDVEGAGADEE